MKNLTLKEQKPVVAPVELKKVELSDLTLLQNAKSNAPLKAKTKAKAAKELPDEQEIII